jgi:Acetyltransferase (isoleucine patch superfamily)
MSSFYSREELNEIGFQYIGEDVNISRKTSIYGAQNISIGDHVRIDDFSIISGNIKIGNYVHVAAAVCLFGGSAGIEFADFVGVSSRSAIYAESDDYSGEVLTNPMVPVEYKHIISGKVILEKHVLVGTGSTILPGVTIHEGTSVGSMSLVNQSLDSWGMYVGVPCRRLKDRKKDLLKEEKKFLKNID